MKITYKRTVSHCELSPYVKMVTIDTIAPAKNSDFLDKVTFREMGWNAVTQKNLHRAGDQVMFIPAESVLPFELSEALEVTKYLSKGRVRVAKFRGNRSEGLIVSKGKVEPYLPYILKWEDPPTVQMRGQAIKYADVPFEFVRFYKIPNILNEPDTFRKGEELSQSEKTHGINLRCGNLKHPHTEEYQLYVGSHNIVLKETEKNIYWRVVREKLADKLPKDVTFFGEIFGPGIQHLHYDRDEPDVFLFAAMRDDKYLNPLELMSLCRQHGLPYIDTYSLRFESIEQVRELAEAPSELASSHGREGIVLVSMEHPDRMAKCISFTYLTGKKRKERH